MRAVPMRLATYGAARRGASKASGAGLVLGPVRRSEGHGGDAVNAKGTALLLLVGETALQLTLQPRGQRWPCRPRQLPGGRLSSSEQRLC